MSAAARSKAIKLEPRPGILDIQAYVGGKAELEGRDDIIRLAANESPLGPSAQALQAYAAAGAGLNRYPDGGSTALREALARHYGLEAGRIVCGNGSDELIALITRAYAGPGDEVLFTEHGFAMYPIATKAAGASPVVAPETDLTADIDALLARVSERTRIVFIANPNNPTGSYLPAAEIVRLRQKLPETILLVIDAAYAEYVTRNDYTSGAELVEPGGNVVMTRTFSKIYALAGVRLGWAYCPSDVADVFNRIRNPFNVTAPALAAGLAALGDMAHLDRARTHNDIWLPRFTGGLEALGLEVAPSVGNFVLVRFPDDEAHNAAAADKFLNSRGIIARGVANYGLPQYLRFTVGTDREVEAVLAALKDFLA
ncbi:MAG: histidinol-phosphate transaminase [Alphaproteobacteria bacterium]